MNETSLNDLVRTFRSSGAGRDLIMEKVAALVYDCHAKYGFDSEDDAANALLKFKVRIDRLVDRFEDRGIPFDAYLASSLRYLARTVRRERRRVSERESVCERASFLDASRDPAEAEDDAAVASVALTPLGESIKRGRLEAGGGRSSKRRPRARGGIIPRCPAEAAAFSSRLVFLTLKCAWELDEAGVSRAAAAAGVGREWLSAAVEQARRSLEAERARVCRLMERRNASWTRLRLLEARLGEGADSYRKAKLASALERECERYANVKAELSRLRTIVPNSIVARILGVPKGTVDSGLYYLRKRYGPNPTDFPADGPDKPSAVAT